MIYNNELLLKKCFQTISLIKFNECNICLLLNIDLNLWQNNNRTEWLLNIHRRTDNQSDANQTLI